MTNPDSTIGYFKVRHTHPDKTKRLPARHYFYTADRRDKQLALSAAMAARAGSSLRGKILPAEDFVISQYDPRNECHPSLEVVA